MVQKSTNYKVWMERLGSFVIILALLFSATPGNLGLVLAAGNNIAAQAFAPRNAAVAAAVLTLPASTQFDLTGFIQSATLNPACAGDAHCGGVLVLNGHVVTVPKETIVILPANALTWQELFAQSPAPYTGGATGMAMADVPVPASTYEAHVIGNRVGNQYIAGMINISQQDLNTGAGYINFMDYNTGEMRVGGVINDSTTGARVQLNDPSGRFGRIMSPDPRFTVDADNPTIAAGTGFPMCFPRTDPAVADDVLCPQGNRPIDPATGSYAMAIQMNDPIALAGVFPDATRQAPFEVGDYVTFAGTLLSDGSGPYISAHTIGNNVAVYTWPGTNPAYVAIEVGIIGTGGLTAVGLGEAAVRTKFEGMSTDPSRKIHLYGIDLDPLTGANVDRDWGTIGVDPGPIVGAVKGRWRFRPPCTSSVATEKLCTPPPAGTFLPPTREVRAVIEGAWVPGQTTAYANGIIAGQYHAPIDEYIFPENVPGSPIVENNFNTMDFLTKGGYTSAAGTIVGQLNPWPSNIIPSAACNAPVAKAGGSYTVASGGTVSLLGSATGTTPITLTWTVPAIGTLSSTSSATPVYTAPVVAVNTVVNLAVTATNACGSNTGGSTVTINAPSAPTINHIVPLTVYSGAPVSMTATGTDPGGLLPLSFSWLQTASTGPVVLVPNPKTGATISFTAPILPLGQVTPDVLNFRVTTFNSAGVASAPEFTSVTVNPLPDVVTITTGQYRTSKLRLDITVTSNVVSPNVVMTLQPYLTKTGTIFNPATLGAIFTNTGAGLYSITLVGAPQPACNASNTNPCTINVLVVRSNLGGSSPAAGVPLSNIRN